jgi:hypothetical protein
MMVKTLVIFGFESVARKDCDMSIHVLASQPGRCAYEDSVRLDTGGIVTGLREILGAQLVAYLGRVSNTRSVREWADVSRAPGADVVHRLRTSY